MWVQYKAPKHQIEGPCLPQRRLLLVQRRVERRGPRACRCQALRHSPTDRTVHQPHPSQSGRAFANQSDQLQLSELDTAGGQHLTLYTPPPLNSHTTPLGDSNRLWNLCSYLIVKEFLDRSFLRRLFGRYLTGVSNTLSAVTGIKSSDDDTDTLEIVCRLLTVNRFQDFTNHVLLLDKINLCNNWSPFPILSSKGNFPPASNFRAVCGAYLVT